MPRRKDIPPKEETVKVRLRLDIIERCNRARLSGLHKSEAESRFLGVLVEMGLLKYEMSVLPIAQGEDETPPVSENKNVKEKSVS